MQSILKTDYFKKSIIEIDCTKQSVEIESIFDLKRFRALVEFALKVHFKE